jgi:hypothetical protein
MWLKLCLEDNIASECIQQKKKKNERIKFSNLGIHIKMPCKTEIKPKGNRRNSKDKRRN